MTMRINIITLFPDLFPGPLGASITGRAITQGTFEIIQSTILHMVADQACFSSQSRLHMLLRMCKKV